MFCVVKEDYRVHGVSTGLYRGHLKKRALAKWVGKHASKKNDIVIFATNSYTVNMPSFKTIAIQHGVSWDNPKKESSKRRQFWASLANHRKHLSYVKANTKLVCVDHNFVNWYRTWFNTDNQQMKVIYNCYKEKINNDELAMKWSDKNAPLKIFIAQRFVDDRGISLIAP